MDRAKESEATASPSWRGWRSADGTLSGALADVRRAARRRRERGECAALAGTLPAGLTLGRYVLGQKIGCGGYGAVFAARDPLLDRDVAIKVVLGPVDGSAESLDSGAMLAEAHAIARICHRNVVTVHDAGRLPVGLPWGACPVPVPERAAPGVYIVMERVRGRTLATWTEKPRSERHLLAVLSQAGAGLAAAHRAGVIHRDVKPSNIMVTGSERALVLDFGIARAGVGPAPDGAATSTIAGTPRYMAPEQHVGSIPDAKSDQFSFCAMALELLAGQPVFTATTLEGLYGQKIAGVHRVLLAGLPAKLAATLDRGLRVDPRRRHASMSTLVTELARPRRGRRWAMWTVASAGVGVFIASTPEPAASPCDAVRSQADRTWTAADRARVRAAFADPDGGEAEAALVRLDRYAGEVRTLAGQVCDGQRDAPDLPAIACVARRSDDLRRAMETLWHAAEPLSGHEVDLLSGLPAPGLCAQPTADATDIELARTLNQSIWEAHRDLLIGELPAAQRRLEAVVERAQRANLTTVEARGRELLGTISIKRGAYAEGTAQLKRALVAADASGADEVGARVLGQLVFSVGYGQGRSEEARWYHQLALARTGKVAVGRKALEAKLAYMSGLSEIVAGRLHDARESLRKAVALYERGPRRHSNDLAEALMALASVTDDIGEPERAWKLAKKALDARLAAVGAEHPDTQRTRAFRAGLAAKLGCPDRAVATLQAALDALPHSPGLRARLAYPFAQVLLAQGRAPEALALSLAAAKSLAELGHDERHWDWALNRLATGLAYLATDDARATGFLQDAVTGLNRSGGIGGPWRLAFAELSLGRALARQGEPETALKHFDAAAHTDHGTNLEAAQLAPRIACEQSRAWTDLAKTSRAFRAWRRSRAAVEAMGPKAAADNFLCLASTATDRQTAVELASEALVRAPLRTAVHAQASALLQSKGVRPAREGRVCALDWEAT